MIVFSVCNLCLQTYSLSLSHEASSLLKEISNEDGLCPCPRHCGGVINTNFRKDLEYLTEGKKLLPAICLTGQELYRGVKGMGLPDEIPKNIMTIQTCLKDTRIESFDVEEINNKFYLHELRLSNGAVIHLTSGSRGCQILKITQGK